VTKRRRLLVLLGGKGSRGGGGWVELVVQCRERSSQRVSMVSRR
jgi:hypothetical protein